MNLGEIRQQFCDLTGRLDLNVSGDQTKGNFFIKAGQKFLDSHQPTSSSFTRYQRDIYADQYVLRFKNRLSVNEVWILDSDGRKQLEKKSIGYLWENYSHIATKAIGEFTFSSQPSINDTISIDGTTFTFVASSSNSTEITIGSDLSGTIDNSVTMINAELKTVVAERIGTTILRIVASSTGTDGNSIALAESSTSISVDSQTLGYVQTGSDGDSISNAEPEYFSLNVPRLSPQQQALTTGNYSEQFTYGAGDLILNDQDEPYASDAIIFMPPADKLYTMVILGQFYANFLESDSDKNFWSVRYEDMLIAAAMMQLEKFYRNFEGYRAIKAALMDDLRGVDWGLVNEDIAGVNQMEELI